MTIRSISINQDLEREVVKHCTETGRTVSGLISFLLREYLQKNTVQRIKPFLIKTKN